MVVGCEELSGASVFGDHKTSLRMYSLLGGHLALAYFDLVCQWDTTLSLQNSGTFYSALVPNFGCQSPTTVQRRSNSPCKRQMFERLENDSVGTGHISVIS